MSIDQLLTLLEPILPEQVRTWRRALSIVQPDIRQLLEQQIGRMAAQHFGDVQGRLLLPPPPRTVSRGPIRLGTVLYHEALWPFGLHEQELLQHCAILGRSGAGKTNVVFSLLQQLLARGIPFLFLDWKRTARHVVPQLQQQVHIYTPGRAIQPFHFNPFVVPDGMEAHVYLSGVVDLLGQAYTLGDGAKSLLQRVLAESGDRTVEGVLAALEQLPLHGREQEWRISAVRALRTLAFARAFGDVRTDQVATVRNLTRQSSVIELNGLHENAKRFLIPVLVQWLYQQFLQRREREQLSLVVILEECHNLFVRGPIEAWVAKLLRECRELGVACILVGQHPHRLSAAALGNCFATICLNLKDPRDVQTAGKLCLLSQEQRQLLSTLPVGQGVVKLQDRWTKPFLVQFPLVVVAKGSVTDADLATIPAGSAGSRPARLPDQEQAEVRQRRLPDVLAQNDTCTFVLDVLQHPTAGVKERYQRLGFSVDRGNRIKQELVRHGFVEAAVVPMGKTRRVALRVTCKARHVLELDHEPRTRESLRHAFWKQQLAQGFAGEGWQVEIEGLRRCEKPELGRADLVLTKGKARWAVEVETGKSDVVQNVRQGLRAGLAKVLVVPTDERARQQVELRLAREGLLIAGRIQLYTWAHGHGLESSAP